MNSYREHFKGNEKGAAIIYRYLGVFAAFRLKDANITPNQVTTIGFLFGFLSAILFAFGNHFCLVLATFLYQLCIVADYCDGPLARLKDMKSNLGVWLEAVLDPLREFFVILGICLGLYVQGAHPIVWVLGFILCGTNFMMDIEALTYEYSSFAAETTDSFASQSKLFAFGKHFLSIRTTRYIALIFFGITGQMFAFLVFFSLYNIGVFLLMTFLIGRIFRNQDDK